MQNKLSLTPILLMLILFSTIGCRGLTRGSSSQSGSNGMLYTLNYSDSTRHVGVAFVFPATVDLIKTHDGSGGDHLSMSDGKWNVDRVMRFSDTDDEIDISFNYLATESIFTFRDQDHALSSNELIVVRFDKSLHYETEILKWNDTSKDDVLREIGVDQPEATPTQPAGAG